MRTIKMDIDSYTKLLDERFEYAQKQWGNDKTEHCWEMFRNYIEEIADELNPQYTSPSYIVDNFVINSDLVSREEFEKDCNNVFGNYETFADYCENNAVLYNDDYAIINLGI